MKSLTFFLATGFRGPWLQVIPLRSVDPCQANSFLFPFVILDHYRIGVYDAQRFPNADFGIVAHEHPNSERQRY